MFEGLMQPMHLLVILIIAMLVFGPKKIPEIGKAIGEGIKGFKDSVKDTPANNTNSTTQNSNSGTETKS